MHGLLHSVKSCLKPYLKLTSYDFDYTYNTWLFAFSKILFETLFETIEKSSGFINILNFCLKHYLKHKR